MAAIPITHGHVWFSCWIVRTHATSTRKKANLVGRKNCFSSHEGNFRDGSFLIFIFIRALFFNDLSLSLVENYSNNQIFNIYFFFFCKIYI